MITFKEFIEEEKYVPEWEKECWVTAIHKTLGTPDAEIKKLAKKAGWDGVCFGAPVNVVIKVIWDLIGKMPDLALTKAAKGMTPKEFSGTQEKTGVVFTRGHVMPMVNGIVSNFNGYGEDEVVVVASFDVPKLTKTV